MSTRQFLLLIIAPVLLIAISAALFVVSSMLQDGVDLRKSKFPALHASAQKIDRAANLREDSDNSASALVRIIVSSDQFERGSVQILRGLSTLLLSLGVLQIYFSVIIWRRTRPSN